MCTTCSLPYMGVSLDRDPTNRDLLDRDTRGQTDACENITLRQTSFAGGYQMPVDAR